MVGRIGGGRGGGHGHGHGDTVGERARADLVAFDCVHVRGDALRGVPGKPDRQAELVAVELLLVLGRIDHYH